MSIKRLYALMLAACALVHVGYFVLFYLIGAIALSAVNTVSLVVYLALLFAVSKGYFAFTIAVAHGGIYAHFLIVSLYLGWGNGFEYILLCLFMMEGHFMYRHPIVPRLLRVADAAVFVLAKLLGSFFPPLYAGAVNAVYQSILYFFGFAVFLAGALFSAILCSRNNRLSSLVLEEKNRYLQTLAETDPLTSLLNRRSMTARLDAALRRKHETGEDFCVAMCDIDDFKQINDVFGHACGDYVLRMLSGVISEYLDKDDAVCRWGGEEILVLFEDTGLDEATGIVEGLRRAIETTTFAYNGTIICITMTIGVSVSRQGATIADMVNEADMLMYTGKRSGKNCVNPLWYGERG